MSDRESEKDKPHVLLVEDYDDAREVCAALLEAQGYRVSTATNGVEAVEKAQEEHPDVVLMDLSLPLMDGVTAIQKLKQQGETKDIPVALMTGHVAGKRSEDAQSSGCDMVIAKPCMPEELESRIKELLAKKPTPATLLKKD
ncbi:MAG TPA: response regulator [Actinomycetota bacterium]|nr:response regulator [Actinomycetota bacterium]